MKQINFLVEPDGTINGIEDFNHPDVISVNKARVSHIEPTYWPTWILFKFFRLFGPMGIRYTRKWRCNWTLTIPSLPEFPPMNSPNRDELIEVEKILITKYLL